MEWVEFQWLHNEPSFKQALQVLLNCSGQQLKKFFSSKELSRTVEARSSFRLPLDLVNHLKINPLFSGPKPILLEQRENYLVVHKPAGIHSHPHAYSDQNTLLNFLCAQKKWEALAVNGENYDRGLLYRLDFETSGLMIVATEPAFFTEMRIIFNERMKRKFYWAVLEGDFTQEGEWTHYFSASGPRGSIQKVSQQASPGSHEGKLEVRKLLSQNGKSLVLVNLATGLRHQIRAQLAALGFPILGDTLYGGKLAERVYLHAFRYEWDLVEEDRYADLFESFFDLDRALQMSHDMLGRF